MWGLSNNGPSSDLIGQADRLNAELTDRLGSLAHDLFVPPKYRLSERERALMMSALRHLTDQCCLHVIKAIVAQSEAESNRPFPSGAGESSPLGRSANDPWGPDSAVASDNASGRGQRLGRSGLPDLQRYLQPDARDGLVWQVIESAPVLRSPAVLMLLRRRADEFMMGELARRHVVEGVLALPDPVTFWSNQDSAGLGQAAMAYQMAETTALGAFADPVIRAEELRPDDYARLCWSTAAQVRDALLAEGRAADLIDWPAAVSAAAFRQSASVRLSDRADQFAAVLDRASELDSNQLAAIFAHGHSALFVAGLARITRVPTRSVWRVVTARQISLLAGLLERAGLIGPRLTQLLSMMDSALSGGQNRRRSDVALETWNALSRSDADTVMDRMRVDPRLAEPEVD